MVILSTSEEWQTQTSLLLKARPTTVRASCRVPQPAVLMLTETKTRITTKYNIPNLDAPKYQKPKKRKRDADGDEKENVDTPKVPRATLTLKTYDPESGVVLKFKTDRAAEVGRLIGSLGRVGRHMAALPEKEEGKITGGLGKVDRTADMRSVQDVPMDDVADTEQGGIASLKESTPATNDAKPQQGGGKKKKKNKK